MDGKASSQSVTKSGCNKRGRRRRRAEEEKWGIGKAQIVQKKESLRRKLVTVTNGRE